jgi:DNA/RNA-binding domain of Phe-tRNA-synthetase-like protein
VSAARPPDVDPDPQDGWIDHELALEFPALALATMAVATAAGHRRTDPAVAERLRALSDRFTGRRAVAIRREPVPAAYRAFFRHVGLDPDVQRTPVEAAVLERLVRGGFASRGPLDDALLLAVVETAVPVWAFDDEALDGPLGLRAARRGERLGDGPLASDLPAGRLVVADAARPVAVLFGDVAPSARAGGGCRRVRLVAVRVPGVPAIHAEEALWTAAEVLGTDPPGG